MSIVGIGTDIVEIERVRRALTRHGNRFAERILTAAELAPMRRNADPAALLARRFAAKEAAAKALGCGIGAEAGFHDLIIDHDAAGAPRLVFSGNAAERAQRLGVKQTHLSISDERHYSLAFVVLTF